MKAVCLPEGWLVAERHFGAVAIVRQVDKATIIVDGSQCDINDRIMDFERRCPVVTAEEVAHDLEVLRMEIFG